MKSLSEHVAVVTGASQGIGRAIANALAQEGARVGLLARTTEKLEEVRGEITSSGGEARVMTADVRRPEQIDAVFDDCIGDWSRLDILVNAAGLGLQTTISEGDPADWQLMWEVNVLGLAIASRAAMQRFDRERGGHIVHVSSMAGHRVPPMGGFYAATKFAVRALTEVMRNEMKRQERPIRISSVSPGLVETDFFDHYFRGDEGKVEEILDRYERVLQADDVAAAVLHLLTTPDHVEVHDILIRSRYQAT